MRLRIKNEYTWNSTTLSWTLIEAIRYVYDGMLIVQERNGGGYPLITYTRGIDLSGTPDGAGGIGGLLARSHGHSTLNGTWSHHHHYHADGNGNITAMVGYNQVLSAAYRYQPFGTTITSSGSMASANLMRFSSKLFHTYTDLYYSGYRFYHPNLQRWPNRDPIGEFGFEAVRGKALGGGWAELLETPNVYAFVRNDPVGEYDPDGLRVEAHECEQFRIRCYKDVFNSVARNGVISAGKTAFAYGIKRGIDLIANLGKTASKCLGGGVAAFGVYSLGSNISDAKDEADLCAKSYDRCIEAASNAE